MSIKFLMKFNNEIDKDNIVEMFAEKFENLAKEMPGPTDGGQPAA